MVYESVYSQPHCLIQGSLSDPEPELEDVGTRLPGRPPQDHTQHPIHPRVEGAQPLFCNHIWTGTRPGTRPGRGGGGRRVSLPALDVPLSLANPKGPLGGGFGVFVPGAGSHYVLFSGSRNT